MRRTHGSRDDQGSVLVLGLGFVVVTMLAVGLVVDASRLFLARRSLASLADGAALRGAHDLDLAALYRSGAPGGSGTSGTSGAPRALPLSAARVRSDVAHYVVDQSAVNGLRGVRVTGVTVVAGTVEVSLAMTESVPLLGTILGHPEGELVTATARARTEIAP